MFDPPTRSLHRRILVLLAGFCAVLAGGAAKHGSPGFRVVAF